MKMKTFGIAAIAAALSIGVAPPAAAAIGDGRLGGPIIASGGVADDTLCPNSLSDPENSILPPVSSAVIGVEGMTRTIGRFIPIVAVARAACSDGSLAPGTMGGGTGTPGSTYCPLGQVAVGIGGKEGDFVDLLQLRCRNSDGSGPITTTAGFGGGFGVPDGPYDCAEGSVLTGLDGQLAPDGITIRYFQIVCSPAPPDGDGDGVTNADDNCPTVANADQADGDGDGIGNACDEFPNDPANDVDGDGVGGDTDNCPGTGNADQADSDGDGIGDACDEFPNDPANDVDGDGVGGDTDNCPGTGNADQADSDGDGIGDACDGDNDNDGIPDTAPPANKDQCTKGGWATFNNPSFRNQGQCVSYVTTNGN